MEYLDRAGELIGRHGSKLYPDQGLAKKEILKAEGDVARAGRFEVREPVLPNWFYEPVTLYDVRA